MVKKQSIKDEVKKEILKVIIKENEDEVGIDRENGSNDLQCQKTWAS